MSWGWGGLFSVAEAPTPALHVCLGFDMLTLIFFSGFSLFDFPICKILGPCSAASPCLCPILAAITQVKIWRGMMGLQRNLTL